MEQPGIYLMEAGLSFEAWVKEEENEKIKAENIDWQIYVGNGK